MPYQSDVKTLQDLKMNYKSKPLVWQTDCIALLREFQNMAHPEHISQLEELAGEIEAHVNACTLRQDMIERIDGYLADIVKSAVAMSCGVKPALIDRFNPGLVWDLDMDACKACGVEIGDGTLEDDGWYCEAQLCFDEAGVGTAPHGFDRFSIRLDRESREYLAYRCEPKYFNDMLYDVEISHWLVKGLTDPQLEDIAAWLGSLRAAAYVRC